MTISRVLVLILAAMLVFVGIWLGAFLFNTLPDYQFASVATGYIMGAIGFLLAMFACLEME